MYFLEQLCGYRSCWKFVTELVILTIVVKQSADMFICESSTQLAIMLSKASTIQPLDPKEHVVTSNGITFHMTFFFIRVRLSVDLDWLSMCLVDWSLLKLHTLFVPLHCPYSWNGLTWWYYSTTLLVLLSCVLVFYNMVLRRGRDYVARKDNFLNM